MWVLMAAVGASPVKVAAPGLGVDAILLGTVAKLGTGRRPPTRDGGFFTLDASF